MSTIRYRESTQLVANKFFLTLCALLLVLFGNFSPAQAQAVGEVEFARGVGFVQTTGQNPRTLGKGVPLQEGDRLTTSDGSTAIVKMQDGTRMTVRPNSDMLIQQYQFKEGAQDNSMVMQLLRGGFRAITGLISKNSPNSARVVTKTATIGIRGTDFDVRLCTTDCKAESAKFPEQARANAVQASAKVVSTVGEVFVTDANGNRRTVVAGGSMYPGETVETTVNARAVLVFRDESRMTLGTNARFKIDSFVFDEANAKDGRFLVSLLRGSLRALTGLIGKSNNRNVGFTTATATIGIRGTGLDLDCSDGTSCRFLTWQGTIEVTPIGQTMPHILEVGQGLLTGPNGAQPQNVPPLDHLPRPDGVTVDTKQLFATTTMDDGKEGLFVFVRDGHIEVATLSQVLHLGRGEAGFAAPDGTAIRPAQLPLFLEFDRTPMPNSKNPLMASVLAESGARPLNQCRQ